MIKLHGFEENATIALLIKHSQSNEGTSEDAKKMEQRLEFHPLAVNQAEAYIRKRKLRLSDLMDYYKRRKKIILENTPQLSQYSKRLSNAKKKTSLNVFTTWELSSQKLQSATENDVETKFLTL